MNRWLSATARSCALPVSAVLSFACAGSSGFPPGPPASGDVAPDFGLRRAQSSRELSRAARTPDAASTAQRTSDFGELSRAASSVEPLAASVRDPTAEVKGLLDISAREPTTAEPSAVADRVAGFGVRLGVIMLGASEWGSDFLAGLYLSRGRSRPGGTTKTFFDINLDFSKEEDTAAASNATYFRAYVGLGGRTGIPAGTAFSAAYGLGLAYELTELSTWDRIVDRFALAGRLGLGLAPPARAWEMQLTYSVFLGESALGDELLFAVAVGF